jgi:hypothetical protein
LPDFDELRRSTTLVEGMASYGRTSLIIYPDQGRPLNARANIIYGDFFEVLGLRPVAGRLLTAAETAVDADPLVAVISERLWESWFDRSPDAIGRTFRAGGGSLTVVGVVGGGFRGPERGDEMDLWIPRAAINALAGLLAYPSIVFSAGNR